MSCFPRIFKRSSSQKEEETELIRNGRTFQEKLIASFDGKRNPIRSFPNTQLKTAIKNCNARQIVYTEIKDYKLYGGFFQDRGQTLLMKYCQLTNIDASEHCFNNIVYASQMNHKNILKFIGCCFETEIPTLVFEYAEYGTLSYRLYGHYQSRFRPLLLTHRLKIAMEIANAVAYLHVGFPRPVVFRNIEPRKIIFYEEYAAKLFDFSLSRSIPEGKTYINDRIVVSFGFGAPEYLATGHYNEKSDVYSFGTLLFELLTGKSIRYLSALVTGDDHLLRDRVEKYIKSNRFNEIVDPVITGDRSCPGKEEKLQEFLALAFKCLSESAEDRPTMVAVAKQLRQTYRSCM